MAIDIQATMDEIARIERLQAQVELRANQISENEIQLYAKLAELGVEPKDIESKILELESAISERLTHIGNIDKPVTLPSAKPDDVAEETGIVGLD